MPAKNAHHHRCVCLSAKVSVHQALVGLGGAEKTLPECKAKRKIQEIIKALERQENLLMDCVTAGNDFYAEEVGDAATDGQ